MPPNVDVIANIEKATLMSPFEFLDAVKSRDSWDYKMIDLRYEDFGNFNFGATCSAAGFLGCSAAAGAYQVWEGNSRISWWSTYFDQPKDQYWIDRGKQLFISYQKEFMWWAQPNRKRRP